MTRMRRQYTAEDKLAIVEKAALFGTQREAAEALGVAQTQISSWTRAAKAGALRGSQPARRRPAEALSEIREPPHLLPELKQPDPPPDNAPPTNRGGPRADRTGGSEDTLALPRLPTELCHRVGRGRLHDDVPTRRVDHGAPARHEGPDRLPAGVGGLR